ncbi:MAG: CPBP family intramembrane glutamic endopeptidase [Bacteroidales bacterium]
MTLFTIVVLLMSLLYPLSGYYQSKKLREQMLRGIFTKEDWYKSSLMWSWVPTSVIIILSLLSGSTLADLGFRLPSKEVNDINSTVYIIALSVALLYFVYNIYCIISLKISKKTRIEYSSKIHPSIKLMLPSTKKEKQAWTLLSITAGVTEEVQYRGYIFMAVPLLFPLISPVYTILISTILFGLGHIYQGREVIKPVLAGVLLSVIYFCTGSIFIVIILHSLQDLVAKEVLNESD